MKIGVDIDDTMADTFDYLMPYIAEFFKIDIKYLKDNLHVLTLPLVANNIFNAFDELIEYKGLEDKGDCLDCLVKLDKEYT